MVGRGFYEQGKRLAHVCVLGLVCAGGMVGCSSRLDGDLVAATDVGRYGGARVALQKKLDTDTGSRDYILSRMRLLILTLADGQPATAEVLAGETFRVLSTRGVNADRTVSSVVFTEGVRIWKGEPFEQAFGYTYIAIQKAMMGEWDNARAAANNSLFRLKDFTDNERTGRNVTTEELARRAAAADARKSGGGDEYLSNGYVAADTDFTFGYVLTALASKALGREEEAVDYLNKAASLNAGFATYSQELANNDYNTVFVVDYGRGPAKVAYGPDNSLVRFAPISRSDQRGLDISIAPPGAPAGTVRTYPWLTDVNQMAASHTWNNLEDVRSAKSAIGTALLVGGGAVAIGSDDDDNGARTAGLIAVGLGLLMKASAGADTRHCEFLPQRVYVVPANITQPGTTVTLSPSGDPGAGLTLTDLAPPGNGQRIQLCYVRLPARGPVMWGASGQTVYANERTERRVSGDVLPFIMGGRCVRPPNETTMLRYQEAGNLTDLTASELENIYREEGVTLTPEEQRGGSRKHVLEGGDSLIAPLAGTTGYQRLFGQLHGPYQPRSAALRDYIDRHPPPAANTGK